MSETQQHAAAERGWSEYWAKDGASGEVFVNTRGEAHPEVAAWWREAFAPLASGSHIVDLACGAGSVFAHLPDGHGHTLHGADISEEALALLRQRLPDVTTTACSADALPFADGRFDAAVSQFGIEYAGTGAFAEAARVVATGGWLIALCHIEDGYIDARNRAHLAAAKEAAASGFIDRAVALIDAAFSGDRDAALAAGKAFQPAERRLAAACRHLADGIHAHLYAGFRQLFERRNDYHRGDIEGWLAAMRDDLDLNVARLEHMCRAARSRADMNAVIAMLGEHGFGPVHCEPLQLSGHDRPLAWAVRARRARPAP